MTHFSDQISQLKSEIAQNRMMSSNYDVPPNLTIPQLEVFIIDKGGNTRAEANQLLQNLKKLKDLEKQNIHGKTGRPSPRTQGVTAEGETFQKFGTQQLEFIDPAKPASGVKEVDVGATFKELTTSGYTGTKTTVFSERLQAGITGAVPVELHEEAVKRQEEKLEEMGIPSWSFPDLTTLFPPASPNGNGIGTGCECENCKKGIGECSDKNPKCNAWDIGCELFGADDKHGCECKACKNGTGQCSDKVPHCDAWDLLCEGTGGASEGIIGGTDVWLWVKIILVLIGIGILLWLLRPLFGIAKNITEK